MKLLFITQKIKEDDDDLAFVILWIKEFIHQGVDVEVIALEVHGSSHGFPVHSLGKERGAGKLSRIVTFLKLIVTLKYDRVFVHMNPEYVTLGGWYWFLARKPLYLWYTHYTMHVHLWLSGLFSKRMFAATPQSLPQYEGNLKKVITGHGIDLAYWTQVQVPPVDGRDHTKLISVHRLCRSKRLERSILALKHLPEEYTLTVYGRDVEKDYYKELLQLVAKEGLGTRVQFMGPVPMEELQKVYPKHRIMVNMAMETIDKTMLEGMLYGVYPVVTPGNAKAIGVLDFPEGEEPEDVAAFIRSKSWKKYDTEALQEIVEKRHSLRELITKMNKYIIPGN